MIFVVIFAEIEYQQCLHALLLINMYHLNDLLYMLSICYINCYICIFKNLLSGTPYENKVWPDFGTPYMLPSI